MEAGARTYEGNLAAGMDGPPRRCADGLMMLARHAGRMEEKLRKASPTEAFEYEGEIYEGDSHFDNYQTRVWATTLARLAEAR